MTKPPSARRFSESELPRQRSTEESLAVIQAGLAQRNLRRQRQQLRKGSQAEAQASQVLATQRFDPHGYD